MINQASTKCTDWLAFGADSGGIYGSDGRYRSAAEISFLRGRFLCWGLDLAVGHALREGLNLRILATSDDRIVRATLGRCELVDLEAFGIRGPMSGEAGATIGSALREFVARSGWKLRSSLGGIGVYDVLPGFLRKAGIPGDAAMKIRGWREPVLSGLLMAGREYSEPGFYRDCYHYDINSAYGYQAQILELADVRRLRVERPSLRAFRNYWLNKHGIAICSVRIPEDRYGLLPVRGAEQDVDYPAEGGEFTGTWTLNELRYAVERGAEILRIDVVMASTVGRRYLSEFAEWCYDEKLAAQQVGDQVARTFWKQLLNSTIGRIAATGGLYELSPVPWGTWIDRPVPPNSSLLIVGERQFQARNIGLPGAGNRLWTAQIISGQRVRLHQALSEFGGIYAFTDSIISTRPLPLNVGQGLGEWSEQGSGSVRILGVGTYQPSWGRARARGIPAAVASSYIAGETVQFERRHSWRSTEILAAPEIVEVKRER